MKKAGVVLVAGVMLLAGQCFASQPSAVAGGAKFELKTAVQCMSKDGQVFATANGGTCQKGDLAYMDVAFDSDKAGDLADQYCDFDKERPAAAMDVYGVLCYLRTDAPVRASSRN